MHDGGDEVPKFGLTRTSSISWLDVMIDMLPGDSVGYDCVSVSLGHRENVIRIYRSSNHHYQSQLSRLHVNCETMKTSFLRPSSSCTKPR